jgi:signal transduction histidine kinase
MVRPSPTCVQNVKSIEYAPFSSDPLLPADKPLTVLIADDIESSRRNLVALVQQLGYAAIEAKSGEEALVLIEKCAPDVALLDLLMPSMDGFEVAQCIRKNVTGKWIPVIVLSSLEGDEFLEQALAMGAAEYLIKPVKETILRAKLRQYQRILTMQARLSLLAEKQNAISDHIVDAIVTTDNDGKVKEVNRAARELFSIDAEQLKNGIDIQDLTSYPLQELLQCSELKVDAELALSKQFALSHRFWNIGPDKYCTISLHDLSEVRRIERMKDEFLANVSHELRTPLTSIIGALGLVASSAAGKLPDAAQELIQVAKRNGDRLSQLIDDVLDITKLEGNRMPIHPRRVALQPLVAEAIVANLPYAQRTDISLIYEQTEDNLEVAIDPNRFLQIMANLLSNAIKHSPHKATVKVMARSLEGKVQIDVIDQGPGIDPEFTKYLFEKFAQADGSDKKMVSGTGLGLYISRMLVEKMGGSICALPGESSGSIFRIALPRV